MDSKKNWPIIIVAIFTLILASFCALFSPVDKGEKETEKTRPLSTSTTPSPTSTVAATNLVKLEDSGQPLPPKLMKIYPAGGQEIGSKGIVSIQFDQPMDPNTTSSAWSLVDHSGTNVKGTISWPSIDTFQFKPSQPYSPGEVYYAAISNKATSKKEIELVEAINFEVQVADNLIVSQVFPADGTQNIENNSVITVIFNRPVVPLMTIEDQTDEIQLLELSPIIPGRGEWLNSSVYIFHPEAGLKTSTTYTAIVKQGLEDLVGTQLQKSYEWEFTTAAPSISSFALASPIHTTNPQDNYQGVHLDATFSIHFHQAMDKSCVSEAFSLHSFQGEKVPVQLGWPSDDQLVITPTQQLALGTDYSLLLSQTAKSESGGSLEDGLRWNFRTFPFPGILSTYPENNSIQERFTNRFRLQFKSPMNLKTLDDRVIISPEPIKEPTYYYDSWGWSVDYYGLDPSTRYKITVLPGIEDIYGNPIKEEFSFSFQTGDLRPAAYLDLPYAPSIYRVDGPMNFYVSYVNVGSVDVDLYKLPASHFTGLLKGTYNRWDFVPPEDWWSNSWYWENTKPINEITRRGIHLEKASGNKLEPGFYLMTINSPQIESYGLYLDTRLIVISDANLTFKTTQTEGLMWLTDLDTGDPLSDITLKVFDDQFKEVGTGSTNSNGLFYLELPVPDEAYHNRYVMTTDKGHFAFALNDWGSGVSPYEFGIWSDYYTIPDQPMAYVYTDRPLYRPNQTIGFKGIIRGNDDLEYRLLPWQDVLVEISSYNEIVYAEKLPLSSFGSFNGTFTIDEDAALGYYSILVKTPIEGNEVGGVGFSVAEYRKPEFQVATLVNTNDILGGTEFDVEILSEYYSGGWVVGAEVEWALKAADYTFRPIGELNRYSFVDYDRDTGFYQDYDDINRNLIIANGKGKTDENGRLVLSLVADLSETGSSRQLTFEATVTDIAGTSVSNQVVVIAHQAEYYPGVKPSSYVGKAGEEQGFDIVVVDWDGEPVAEVSVDVEFVERRWYSIQEQDEQGFVHWVSSVEEIPVANFKDLEMDSRGRASVKFTPDDGGVYKAKVVVQDDSGNKARSGAYIWISSSDYVIWRQTDDRRLELVADKEKYQPGDIAEILVASPLTGDNYALVTVERGHIREYDVIRLASNSAIYRLPITQDMAPNIYVSVLVIQGAENGGKPDFRMGIHQLNISTGEQEVQIKISPDRTQAGPGDEVTYNIQTTDSNGLPVQAEVSLALADLAALSLIQPNSLPILDYFYSQRALSVRTAVPIVYSIEHYISTLEDRLTEGEGMGSGGGKGADVYGVIDIRGDFRDTAFWQANVITDENGEASVTVELPDNLTTWRMDARAVTLDTLVGDGENDIRSTKPLLLRPQTPRFFVEGDQVTVGTAVHNNTNQELDVEVVLDASGLTVESPASQSVVVAAGSQVYLTWDITIDNEVERVDLTFVAKGGPYTDASRPTLGTLDRQGIPVYKYEAPETVGTAGMLSEGGSLTEGVVIPSKWEATQGMVSIELSPSLVAGMVDGLDYLKNYPYECIEQTISRFLPNVLTTRALSLADITDPTLESNLADQVNVANQRLSNWQRADGGWGWWPEARQSDPLTTAYVVLGLIEANASGYHVSTDMLDRSINYLKANLKSLGSLDQPYLLNRQVFILYVLARAEQPQVSLTVVMYDAHQSLSIYTRALLAETLWIIDHQDPRVDTLISDLLNSATLSASGVHWQENWRDYWNWNSDTRTTAIVLSALIRIDPENSFNSNAVRWLMSNREMGHWRSTQDTAWSIMTLSRWLEFSDELKADYDWAIGMNGERIGDGSATSENYNIDVLLSVDIKDLMLDEINRLTIARDEGSGNMYYSAHLNVSLPVDQIKPLDQGIIISREYFDSSMLDAGSSILRTEQGKLLLARLTIVVPNDLHYIIVNDPLPAGFEAVDPKLETSPEIMAPEGYDYRSLWQQGWGWWYFDHIELRDERVVLSAEYLPSGTYVYTYIVRASTPGTFNVIPPTAQEFYFPEVYGRGAGTKFVIDP